jgi:hypothetical protein
LPELYALNHIAAIVCPDHMKHVIAQINALDRALSRFVANHDHFLLLLVNLLILTLEDGAGHPIKHDRGWGRFRIGKPSSSRQRATTINRSLMACAHG